MRRRRIFLLIGCAATTLVLLILLWPTRHVPEPQYDGESFSQWFDVYCQSGRRPGMLGRAEAVHAIQEIGTNSLPFLLHLMQHETPAWKTALQKITPKLPRGVQGSRIFYWLQHDPKAQQADSTTIAFTILGSQALPAAPELTKLLNDKKHPQTARRAWIAAAIIGQSLAPKETTKAVPTYQILPTPGPYFGTSPMRTLILSPNASRNIQTNRSASLDQNPFAF